MWKLHLRLEAIYWHSRLARCDIWRNNELPYFLGGPAGFKGMYDGQPWLRPRLWQSLFRLIIWNDKNQL